MTKAEEKRAAIVAQQAAREKAEREARGPVDDKASAPGSKKRPFTPRRGPGRMPRPRDDQ